MNKVNKYFVKAKLRKKQHEESEEAIIVDRLPEHESHNLEENLAETDPAALSEVTACKQENKGDEVQLEAKPVESNEANTIESSENDNITAVLGFKEKNENIVYEEENKSESAQPIEKEVKEESKKEEEEEHAEEVSSVEKVSSEEKIKVDKLEEEQEISKNEDLHDDAIQEKSELESDKEKTPEKEITYTALTKDLNFYETYGYVAPPAKYDAVMRKIPKGKLTTLEGLNRFIALEQGVTNVCVETAEVFVMLAAFACVERRDAIATPFWRVLLKDGELSDALPGGVGFLIRILQNEGHEIVQFDDKFYVADYQKNLVDFIIVPKVKGLIDESLKEQHKERIEHRVEKGS